MFAKAAVFFFALAAFINAAPAVDADVRLGPGRVNLVPPNPINPFPPVKVAWKRGMPLEITAGGDFGIEFFKRAPVNADPNTRVSNDPNSRMSNAVPSFNTGVPMSPSRNAGNALPHMRRLNVDVTAGGDFGIGFFKRHHMNAVPNAPVSNDPNTRMPNAAPSFNSGVPMSPIRNAGNALPHMRRLNIDVDLNALGEKIHKVLESNGLNFGVSVEARDITIDGQVLAELQNLVNDTASLLRATGNTRAVNAFLSKVNDLRVEVQNGSLDVNDLLHAAKTMILAIF